MVHDEVTTQPSGNLDLVRSIYATWERGEYFSGSGEWVHPEIEFVVDGGPEPGRWTGLDGLIEGARTILNVWEDWRPEADEYRELDDERILVFFHPSGRGKTSGLDVGDVAGKGANLFQVRGGKVTRIVAYWDRDRALADLGLRQ
jgi:ketosteroid isomerase-like protein